MTAEFLKRSAVYQIYPRSFYDSNGDGIGDIPGIISKLDYLQSLGVDVLWLSPVYPSPNADNGYDVADYTAIHPEYGTIADMEQLLHEAHARGLRIVMDLVINHTSKEHPWFQAALNDPASPYRDYYIFRDGKKPAGRAPPNNWQSIFSGPAWTYVPECGQWYLHLYSPEQPDLHWHNPRVFDEVAAIMRFWLDKGVYGFRCDVINQLYKSTLADGRWRLFHIGREHYSSQPGVHQLLKRLRREVIDAYGGVLIGEAFDVTVEEALPFFDEELDMLFHFEHMFVDKHIIPIIPRAYSPRNLKRILQRWQRSLPWSANYLENHDQLRSIERFGDAQHYYRESATMLAALTILPRGTPFIYQGQEIGMLNRQVESMAQVDDVASHTIDKVLKSFGLPARIRLAVVNRFNRDNARTPMQWTRENNAGFTEGQPWLALNPNYSAINVAAAENDPQSILHWYRQLLNLRKRHVALVEGEMVFLDAHRDVLQFRREHPEGSVLVAINMSKRKRAVAKGWRLPAGEMLLNNYPAQAVTAGERLLLQPYHVLVWRLAGG